MKKSKEQGCGGERGRKAGEKGCRGDRENERLQLRMRHCNCELGI